MNFLAHAVLAGSSAERIAGSLAGDFVKGVLYEQDFPTEFLIGLRLHRRIDAFSNRSTQLRASADRLPPQLRRIAPPCIDMLADHFLAAAAAADPKRYLPSIDGLAIEQPTDSAQSLELYEDSLHQLLKPHLTLLSPAARRFFDHAQNSRLFSNYQTFDRTARGINYVCERLSRAADSGSVIKAMTKHREALRNDFEIYWPELKAEAERFLAQQTEVGA